MLKEHLQLIRAPRKLPESTLAVVSGWAVVLEGTPPKPPTGQQLYLAPNLRAAVEALRLEGRLEIMASADSPQCPVVLVSISDSELDPVVGRLRDYDVSSGTLVQVNLGAFATTPRSFVQPNPLLPPQEALVGRAVTEVATSSLKNITETIERLSSLRTRRAGTDEGRQASNLVEELFVGACAAKHCVEQVAPIVYGKHPQSSVVCRIVGQGNPKDTVILGCHLDSVAWFSRAPGADDDASGVAAMVEAIRAVTAHDLRFCKSIEFHAYAAEERKLDGSDCIVWHCSRNHEQKYKRPDPKRVAAMIQADMVGFQSDRGLPVIWLHDDLCGRGDNVDSDLTVFLAELARRHLCGVAEVAIGASENFWGWSDHLSWRQRGVPTAFLSEDPRHHNTSLHTAKDTLERLNALDLTAACSGLFVAAAGHIGGVCS